MHRIVLATPLLPGQAVQLTDRQRHYLVNVLRITEGEEFIGLDSAGGAHVLRLESYTGQAMVVRKLEEACREPQLAVRLCLPLLKGDKLDLVVQKSVELGVSYIDIYSAQRSVVKGGNLEKKLSRWQRIALEATRQCQRQSVPILRGLLTLTDIAVTGPGVFAWEEEKEQRFKTVLAQESGNKLVLLTGPEGGLTREEAVLLTAAGWKAVTLGPRILRAETAAIAMLTCTMFAKGEMG